MAARVLVTGATGALGRAAGIALAGEDAQVHGLVRTVPPARPRGFSQIVLGDLTSFPWRAAVAGYDAVFHLAAFVHRTPTKDERDELFEVNASATARIAEACRDSGALLVFASTVAVLGRGNSGSADAGTSSEDPLTDYARSKLDAEDAIRREGTRGLEYVILRFPLLYGPHGRGNMERLLRAIARGRYWPFGDQAVPKSCLHFDDAARAMVAAWHAHGPRGRTFVVAPSSTPTLGGIHAAAYAAAGRRMPRPLPGSTVLALARLLDVITAPLGARRKIATQVETLVAPSRHDGAEFASATGFRSEVHLEEGIRATMRWLQSSPGLS